MTPGPNELILVLTAITIGIGTLGLWVWMIIDCATKESSEGNDKVVWLLVILLAQLPGALIYLIVRRPKRIRELGR